MREKGARRVQRVTLYGLDDLDVSVGCDRDGAVAQDPLHRRRRYTHSEQTRYTHSEQKGGKGRA